MGNLLNLQTLTIGGYDRVRSEVPTGLMMPRGIGKLTQLRALPLFVVGKGTDAAGVEELRYLNDLRGTLRIVITSLDNWVPDTEPTILIHKNGLRVLNVTFRVVADESSLASMMSVQEELLESIRPHTNIRQVWIDGYAGIGLPKWMGDPSYSRLEEIQLWGVRNCTVLPAFGQLPALKKLLLWKMYAVTSVGPELLWDGTAANGASVFFASLEKLEFYDLKKVEELSIGTDDSVGAFPRLRSMEIRKGPKLTCVKLRHLTALESLEIEDCPELTTMDYHHNLGGGSPGHIPSIKTMILRECPELNFPPAEWQRLPSSLKVLQLSRSREPWRLRALFDVVNDDSIIEMEELHMGESEKYVLRWDPERHKFSFTPEEAEQLLQHVGPRHWGYRLQELLIEGYLGRRFCDWVGDGHRLRNLVKMTLSGCIHCERLPPVGRLPSLWELYISNMPELQLVGRELCIGSERLISPLPEHNGGHAAFPKLRVLTIINCPKLRSFQFPAPQDTPPCEPSSSSSSALHLYPRLQLLHIQDCPELASLVGIHGISPMRVLLLARCPVLDFSHEAQLPTGLQVAIITGCPLLSGWCQGGERISHLCRLWIDGRLAFSDGTDVNGSLDALREIMDTAGRSITEGINAMAEILENDGTSIAERLMAMREIVWNVGKRIIESLNSMWKIMQTCIIMENVRERITDSLNAMRMLIEDVGTSIVVNLNAMREMTQDDVGMSIARSLDPLREIMKNVEASIAEYFNAMVEIMENDGTSIIESMNAMSDILAGVSLTKSLNGMQKIMKDV